MDLAPVIDYLKTIPAIQIVYLFGSRAHKSVDEQKNMKSADWDFGIVVDKTLDAKAALWLGIDVQPRISALLKTDAVDVVVVNHTKSIELARAIVLDGEVLLDKHENSEEFERHIRHEYEDHKAALRRNFGERE